MAKLVTPFRLGLVVGALGIAIVSPWPRPELLADSAIWSTIAFIILAGAWFGGGMVLAWQNIRRTPKVLIPTTLLILPVAVLAFSPDYSEWRACCAFHGDGRLDARSSSQQLLPSWAHRLGQLLG